jgi:hypothetical protein
MVSFSIASRINSLKFGAEGATCAAEVVTRHGGFGGCASSRATETAVY